jgi:hypothetical protein
VTELLEAAVRSYLALLRGTRARAKARAKARDRPEEEG